MIIENALTAVYRDGISAGTGAATFGVSHGDSNTCGPVYAYTCKTNQASNAQAKSMRLRASSEERRAADREREREKEGYTLTQRATRDRKERKRRNTVVPPPPRVSLCASLLLFLIRCRPCEQRLVAKGSSAYRGSPAHTQCTRLNAWPRGCVIWARDAPRLAAKRAQLPTLQHGNCSERRLYGERKKERRKERHRRLAASERYTSF